MGSLHRTVFDNASDAIFIHDMDGHFVEVNQTACERLGYSHGTAIAIEPSSRIIESKGKLAVLSIAREISERKMMDERYKTIIQTSMDGFWLVDTHGRILDVNDAYSRLSGYSRDELLNMNVKDLEALETPEETAQHIRRIMETGYDRFETRHRRSDGGVVDAEVSVIYLKSGSERFSGPKCCEPRPVHQSTSS